MLNMMLARRTSELQTPLIFCPQHAYCHALMHLFQTHVFVTQLNAIEIAIRYFGVLLAAVALSGETSRKHVTRVSWRYAFVTLQGAQLAT